MDSQSVKTTKKEGLVAATMLASTGRVASGISWSTPRGLLLTVAVHPANVSQQAGARQIMEKAPAARAAGRSFLQCLRLRRVDAAYQTGKDFCAGIKAPVGWRVAVIVGDTVKGSAVNGTHYAVLKDAKKFKPGRTNKPIWIIPLGNLGGAARKVVKLTLDLGGGYTVGAASAAQVKILTHP